MPCAAINTYIVTVREGDTITIDRVISYNGRLNSSSINTSLNCNKNTDTVDGYVKDLFIFLDYLSLRIENQYFNDHSESGGYEVRQAFTNS